LRLKFRVLGANAAGMSGFLEILRKSQGFARNAKALTGMLNVKNDKLTNALFMLCDCTESGYNKFD